LLRSVKYGLYGAVIAGVVSGTVAWQGIDKTVHLVVDGNLSTVHTTADRVSDILHGKGYSVGPHDIVAPAASATVRNGGRIVFARGRLLHLDVNGLHEDVWTTAPTVADALAQLGYGSGDFTSVSRSQRLPLTPTDLMIRTPISIAIRTGGQTDHVATTDVTVGQLIHDLGISLYGKDSVDPPQSTELVDNMVVTVHKRISATIVSTQVIPFGTTVHKTASLPSNQTVVVSKGQNGLEMITWGVVYENGKIIGRTRLSGRVVKAPVNQVVNQGTAPVAVPSGVMATPAQAQQIALDMLYPMYPGSEANTQFGCLAQIYDHESGWRVNAGNPDGAYGIPQALPGYKMASAGADWQTDAKTQITWGLNYIVGRYGSPCAAWSYWQGHGYY